MSTFVPSNMIRNMTIERARPGASERLKHVDACGMILFNQDFSKLLLVYDKVCDKWGFPERMPYLEERRHGRYYECACRAMLAETDVCLRRHRKKYKKINGDASTIIVDGKLLFVLSTDSVSVRSCYPQVPGEPEYTRWFDTDEMGAFAGSSYCSATLRLFLADYYLRHQ